MLGQSPDLTMYDQRQSPNKKSPVEHSDDQPLDFTLKEKSSKPSVDLPETVLDLSLSGLTKNMKTAGVLTGGWVQVNNTLVPYVTGGEPHKLLPLSVLRKAADLMRDAQPLRKATEEESGLLNRFCQEAGVNFVFVKHTKLVTLDAVKNEPKLVSIDELPANDPFRHAEYIPGQGFHPEEPSAVRPNANANMQLPPVMYPGFSFPLMHPVPVPVPINLPRGGPFRHPFPPGGPMMMPPPATQPMFPIMGDNPTAKSMRRWSEPPPIHAGATGAVPKKRQPKSQAGRKTKAQKVAQQTSPSTRPNIYQTSAPNSQDPKAKQSGPTFSIRPFQLHGRPISCLVDGDFRYALLEAVARVFFPESTLKLVQLVIENFLRIPVRSLSVPQEKAFINFYCLPTKILRCRLIVDIGLVNEKMATIKALLKDTHLLQTMAEQDQLHASQNNNNNNHNNSNNHHSNNLSLTIPCLEEKNTQSKNILNTPSPSVLQNKQLFNQELYAGSRATKGRKRSLEDTISHLRGTL